MSSSTFPQSIDTFINNLDITANDSDLIKQYFTAYQAGNITLAQQLFNQIPNNTQKILTASKLNKYQDAIVNIETFYRDNISQTITDKQAQWQATINQFSYKDVYNPSMQYEINNYVKYTSGGVSNLYICYVRPVPGTAPTNTTYWRVLTIRGIQGVSGQGMAFMGEWVSSQAYSVMDCVTYDNALWGCIVANTNETPFEGSTYWQLIYKGGVAIYPVSETEPPVQQTGELWFKILP